MSRLTSPIFAIAVGSLGALLVSSAHAESPAQLAEKDTEAGKALMFQRRYPEAVAKFRSAANRFPTAKAYFNVAAAEVQQNRLVEAYAACRTADKLNPDPVLRDKLAQLEAKIKRDAAAQRVNLEPPAPEPGPSVEGSGSGEPTGSAGGGGSSGSSSGGDPGPATGGPNAAGSGNATTVGPPPPPGNAQRPMPGAPSGQPTPQAPDLFVETKPDNTYTWTVGVDLFGGRGSMGQDDAFGDVVGGIRLRSDYLINPRAKFGSQFYFQGTGFGSGDQSLQLYDTGAAFYKHFCVSRLCITPLAGAHFALMNPSNDSTSTSSTAFNYLGLGARLEGKISYSLGKRFEHVISAAFDANWYTRALSEPMNGLRASSWGLDEGGSVVTLGFGYTYRFNTPVGRVPFLTLE